uniref:Circadian clock-controlled protein n=1 Tax=Ceratitis capitata TaxID=7213 RepID=W8BS25_CERCA
MFSNRFLCNFCVFALLLCIVNAQDDAIAAVSTTNAPTESSNVAEVSSTTRTIITDIVATSSSSANENIQNTEAGSSTENSAAVVGATNAKKYFSAADLPICKLSSSQFNDCIKNLLQKSLERVKDGDKQLNIPTIDPFKLNRTTFQYQNGNIRGRIFMREAQIYGFSKTHIKTLDLKINDGKIKMKALSLVPEMRIVGNYKAEFVLNNVQLRPKGVFNVSLVNVNIDQKYEGGFYEADGHRFVRMTEFDAEPKVGDFKLTATGLFPDPTLNELAVNIVNQYWRQIFQVFLPETRQYWGPMLLRQINEVMSVVPYDVFVVD